MAAQAHAAAGPAVAEGVLQQIGHDLGNGRGVARQGGELTRRRPTPALQGGGPSRAFDQGLQHLVQGAKVLAAEGRRQQQGLQSAFGGGEQRRLGQLVNRLEIAIDLVLLAQQVVHQRLVGAVAFEATPEQLPKGAQGGQGIAQLVDQQLQLVIPEGQLPPEPLLLQIELERFCEAERGGFESIAEGRRPGPAVRINPQGSEQKGAIP